MTLNYRTIWIVIIQPLNKVHTFSKKMKFFKVLMVLNLEIQGLVHR